MNRSPWMEELDANRARTGLVRDEKVSIAIIGAGIAGIATAYFILKHTNENVCVIERDRLAGGATGTNAGMLIAGFERPLTKIAEGSSKELVIDALHEIESAWDLIQEMVNFSSSAAIDACVGYHGIRSLEALDAMLADAAIRRTLPSFMPIIVDVVLKNELRDSSSRELCEFKTKDEIAQLLETEASYVAAVPMRHGLVNSALLTEKTAQALATAFPDRFALYENTRVAKVVLSNESALIDAGEHEVQADTVVLCTNGFEDMTIINNGGLAIDASYHHLVSGEIGFMLGYLTDNDSKAGSYLYDIDDSSLSLAPIEEGFDEVDSYLYLSRRLFRGRTLTCLGGSDIQLPDRSVYEANKEYPHTTVTTILMATKGILSTPEKEPHFSWHGLMGYTPNGVRRVGREPKNPRLMYNIGCNGIGLLPAIAGGRRIARLLAGENLPASLFDPA